MARTSRRKPIAQLVQMKFRGTSALRSRLQSLARLHDRPMTEEHVLATEQYVTQHDAETCPRCAELSAAVR